ncbi:MAG TPA: protein kinase [Ktedonobacteraceae bacterium]|nr:protein kinase [Ktedonobacteraceae bacterium]
MLILDDSSNRYLGDYRLTIELISKASSRIFLGENTSSADTSQQPVVIKWLHTTHLKTQQEKDTFFQEIYHLRWLLHPHILPIISAGVHDDNPYIVMEYAPQRSLYDRFQTTPSKPLPQDEAFTILAQVGQALHYAHQQKMVHGNLKPQNVLFNARGEALLADFHLTSLSTPPADNDNKTSDDSEYILPEDLADSPNKASDQYTLGCLAYEMLTGRKPFMTPLLSNPRVQIKTSTFIPPTRLNPALSSEIEEGILIALAPEPGQRYRDIPLFLNALGINISTIQQDEVTVPSSAQPTAPMKVSAPVPAITPDAPVVPVADTIPSSAQPTAPMKLASPAPAIDPAVPDVPVQAVPTINMGNAAEVLDPEEVTLLLWNEETTPRTLSSQLATPDEKGISTPQPLKAPVFFPEETQIQPPRFSSASAPFQNPSRRNNFLTPSLSSYNSRTRRASSRGTQLFKGRPLIVVIITFALIFSGVVGVLAFQFFSPHSSGANMLVSTSHTTTSTSTQPNTSTPITNITGQSASTATPVSGPNIIPSPMPTTGAVTLTPSRAPIPAPTTRTTATTGLSTNPTALNANTCRYSRNTASYLCTITLKLGSRSAQSQFWLAYVSGVVVQLAPGNGVINPGQTVQINANVFTRCPSNGALFFVAAQTWTKVLWHC